MEHYEKLGKVARVSSTPGPDTVFEDTRRVVEPIARGELLELSQALLDAVDAGDFGAYTGLVHDSVTAFEPEAHGHRVVGLPFHRFFLERRASCGGGCGGDRRSVLSDPHVRLMGDTAVVSYVRLTLGGGGGVVPAEETRVWRVIDGRWRNVHFHRSRASTAAGGSGCGR